MSTTTVVRTRASRARRSGPTTSNNELTKKKFSSRLLSTAASWSMSFPSFCTDDRRASPHGPGPEVTATHDRGHGQWCPRVVLALAREI